MVKRSRGGRKKIDHKALQEAVVYTLENLDPELFEIEKKIFVIKVYIRYYSQTGHRMHTDTYPVNRIRGSICKNKLLEKEWKTFTKTVTNIDPYDRKTIKWTTFMRRIKV